MNLLYGHKAVRVFTYAGEDTVLMVLSGFAFIESYTKWIEYEKETSVIESQYRLELHANGVRWIRGFLDILRDKAQSL